MASVVKIKNTWFAQWRDPDGRRRQRTTKVKVKQTGHSEKDTRKLAQALADSFQALARNQTPASELCEAVMQTAKLYGFAKPAPSIREYLTKFPPLAKQSTEAIRHNAFRVFLEWLGGKADLPLSRLTTEQCQDYIRYLLKEYRVSTVKRHRECLASAFNRAVKVERYLTQSPLDGISVEKEMRVLNVVDDSTERAGFTLDELKTIFYKFPAPYADLAATSFFLAGARLGDVCQLQWSGVDWEHNTITYEEGKRMRTRRFPLIPPLRTRLQNIKNNQREDETYIFPDMAALYNRSRGSVSARFSTLLYAFGIRKRTDECPLLKGKRRTSAEKSFHSVRHSTVTIARLNPMLSADLVRKTVGHSSDKVEFNHYFNPDMKAKKMVLDTLADMVPPPEPDGASSSS